MCLLCLKTPFHSRGNYSLSCVSLLPLIGLRRSDCCVTHTNGSPLLAVLLAARRVVMSLLLLLTSVGLQTNYSTHLLVIRFFRAPVADLPARRVGVCCAAYELNCSPANYATRKKRVAVIMPKILCYPGCSWPCLCVGQISSLERDE